MGMRIAPRAMAGPPGQTRTHLHSGRWVGVLPWLPEGEEKITISFVSMCW